MKKSIRNRLFIGMSCLIVIFVAASWLLNSHYLGKYYIWQKKHTLMENRDRIAEAYKGDPEQIANLLEHLERNEGNNIYLLSAEYEIKYSSFGRGMRADHFRTGLGAGPGPDRIPLINPVEAQLNKLTKGENLLEIVRDPRIQSDFLLLATKLENGELLIISAPLAAIHESASLASQLSLFTGFVTLILGGIAVYQYSKQFTKPILELNEVALAMSRLDFSKKYTVESDDEIGQLGRSINSLSEQLGQSIESLQEANSMLMEDIERKRKIDQMRKEFVSNVSHELKTPIALVQGYAEGLKLNVNDEDSKDFYCEVIMDEAAKMNRLVKDLLDLSQIESGYFKLEISEFDLSALVDQVLAKYKPILTEKEITVQVEKESQLWVTGDVVRIEQVLYNYLNNAINHVEAPKEITIKVLDAADKLRIEVYNSGKPIPEADLEKIWISFYKVDKARTRAYGGTGLGLSVVRAIMELHDNAFGVENVAQGVRFWFEVDRA